MGNRNRTRELVRGPWVWKMCGRKKKYKSGEAGRLAGIRHQRKYECPVCGHWHLTTKGAA